MSSYALSQIRNFRSCNAGVPESLELDAVIETITDGWDATCVQATLDHGLSETDADAIRSLIASEQLTVSEDDARDAVLAWCREHAERVRVMAVGGTTFQVFRGPQGADEFLGSMEFGSIDAGGRYEQSDDEITAAARTRYGIDASVPVVVE